MRTVTGEFIIYYSNIFYAVFFFFSSALILFFTDTPLKLKLPALLCLVTASAAAAALGAFCGALGMRNTGGICGPRFLTGFLTGTTDCFATGAAAGFVF